MRTKQHLFNGYDMEIPGVVSPFSFGKGNQSTTYIRKNTIYRETVEIGSRYFYIVDKRSGGEKMQIEINVDESCKEPKVIVVTNRMTDEINEIIKKLSDDQSKKG